MGNQQLYTVREACDALFGEGYTEGSRKRLRRWINKGMFRGVIVDGNRHYIPKNEIIKMGEANETGS